MSFHIISSIIIVNLCNSMQFCMYIYNYYCYYCNIEYCNCMINNYMCEYLIPNVRNHISCGWLYLEHMVRPIFYNLIKFQDLIYTEIW